MSEASTAAPQHVQTETPSTSKPPNPLKTTYLVLYNFVSAVLWLTILGRVVSISSLTGSTDMVFKTTSEFTKWTQTLALLEVAHSALGESHRCISVGIANCTFAERAASLAVNSLKSQIPSKLTSPLLQVSSAPLFSQLSCKSQVASSWSGSLPISSLLPSRTAQHIRPCYSRGA